jgi:hypothetical protein
MSADNEPGEQPGEVPYRVHTALGPAVITLVCMARDVGSHNAMLGESVTQVDRLVLRSAVAGQSDVYAVFERPSGQLDRWRRITGDLTLAELGSWPAHRTPTAGYVSPAFEAWLTGVAVGR